LGALKGTLFSVPHLKGGCMLGTIMFVLVVLLATLLAIEMVLDHTD
jgi:hypothetical protein